MTTYTVTAHVTHSSDAIHSLTTTDHHAALVARAGWVSRSLVVKWTEVPS